MTWSIVASTSKNLRMPEGRTRSTIDDVSGRGALAKVRPRRVEVGVLLVCVSRAQDRLLVESFADNLQPYRQAFGHATGDRYAWQAGHVHRDGEHVVEVHSQRIVHLFAYLERHRRRGWCDQHVELLESAVEF